MSRHHDVMFFLSQEFSFNWITKKNESVKFIFHSKITTMIVFISVWFGKSVFFKHTILVINSNCIGSIDILQLIGLLSMHISCPISLLFFRSYRKRKDSVVPFWPNISLPTILMLDFFFCSVFSCISTFVHRLPSNIRRNIFVVFPITSHIFSFFSPSLSGGFAVSLLHRVVRFGSSLVDLFLCMYPSSTNEQMRLKEFSRVIIYRKQTTLWRLSTFFLSLSFLFCTVREDRAEKKQARDICQKTTFYPYE